MRTQPRASFDFAFSLPTWAQRVLRSALLVGVLAVVPACIATPLPDPPSVDALRMTLTEDGAGFVRLRGAPGAIRMGGDALRTTNPRLNVRVNITIAPDGSFSTRIDGVVSDPLFLERVRSDADSFLAEVRSSGALDGSVMTVSMPSDRDMDLSPDAIDCAPDDPMLVARQCTVTCISDIECGGGQACMAGVCVPLGCELAETCGDGLDNDCDGVADDGC